MSVSVWLLLAVAAAASADRDFYQPQATGLSAPVYSSSYTSYSDVYDEQLPPRKDG